MFDAEQAVRRDLVRIGATENEVEFLTKLWVFPLTYAEVFAVKTTLAEELARREPGAVGFDTVAATLSRITEAAGKIEDRVNSREGRPGIGMPFVRVAPAVPISDAAGWQGPEFDLGAKS